MTTVNYLAAQANNCDIDRTCSHLIRFLPNSKMIDYITVRFVELKFLTPQNQCLLIAQDFA
jgi:hypothetical protein